MSLVPFGFERLFSPFDSLLFDDLDRSFNRRNYMKKYDEMRVNVREKDDYYEFNVDLPGVSKDDLQLTYDPETLALTIRAERKNEYEEKDSNGRIIRRESSYGKMERRFTLPEGVDIKLLMLPENQPKLTNGVLKFRIKKPPIEIKKQDKMTFNITE
jgi:HSP20 family protein